jgi:hypothetical protein
MVSSNEVSVNLREKGPLPRNILHTEESCPAVYGAANEVNALGSDLPRLGNGLSQLKGCQWSPGYPLTVRDTAKSGMGCMENHHLISFVESLYVNVGGLQADAKISSRSMLPASVGAAIVLGARESRVQGEGPQSVGILAHSNRMLTRRNLL